MAKDNKQQQILTPPKHERGLRKTGYTITGYPFSQFGVPTILHAKKVRLEGQSWKETEADCGGIMKAGRVWVNDLPNGYEVVIGLQCQDCKYTDSIRIPYVGHKQLFNSSSNRTWSLKDPKGKMN